MDNGENIIQNDPSLRHLKDTLVSQILNDFDPTSLPPQDRYQTLIDLLLRKFRGYKSSLPKEMHDVFIHAVVNDVLGFGMLQPYLEDPETTDILVNGADSIIIEKNGSRSKIDSVFQNKTELTQFIQRNLNRLSIQMDPTYPVIDSRLPDNTRLQVILPPVAIESPILALHKFSGSKATLDSLIASEMLDEQTGLFLKGCVLSHLNILITGINDVGKSDLLNALAGLLPEKERIVTIEEFPELSLPQKNVLRFELKDHGLENKSNRSAGDLIHLAIEMHPDHVIFGEIRGGECLTLLQMMNTYARGTLATLRAANPSDAIEQLLTLSLLAGINLPSGIVYRQITSAIDLIIHLARLKDGTRKIISITEITGMENENVILSQLFHYEQTRIDANGKTNGQLKPNGGIPLFISRLMSNGFSYSPEMFGVNFARSLNGH